jgi:hypothetical protein
MDTNHKQWNRGQQNLRQALSKGDHQKAIELFMIQHAMVHSAKVIKTKLWSFEDEVLNDMPEDQIRCLPPGGEHSIAWILFHIARCEDITMNLLVAGTPQLFVKDGWNKKLKVTVIHSGNSMEDTGVTTLSARIDIGQLQAYRQSVGRRTREIVKKLNPEELQQRAEASRLQKVIDEGALLPEAIGILDYWSKRTVSGLLLMPPTRHNFLHLNEALRIKQKLRRMK